MDVLLPAPFGPRNPKISPRGTLSDKFRTAILSPNTLRRFRDSIAKLFGWLRAFPLGHGSHFTESANSTAWLESPKPVSK